MTMPRPRLPIENHVTRLAYTQNLTDVVLSARAGITRAQLNRIRNGRVIPRADTAIAIAAALGRRVKDVFVLR